MIDRFLKFLLKLLPQGGGMAPSMEQEHFRVRDDKTLPTSGGTPNWISTEDQASAITIIPNNTFRVRFVMANVGDANATATQVLYYRLNQTGSWLAVSSTTPIRPDTNAADTSAPVNLTATASFLLTAGTGTAADGEYTETEAAGVRISGGDYTELEYGLRINEASVSTGDLIELRVYQDDGTAPAVVDHDPLFEVSGTRTASATCSFSGDLAAWPETDAEYVLRQRGRKSLGTTTSVTADWEGVRDVGGRVASNRPPLSGSLLLAHVLVNGTTVDHEPSISGWSTANTIVDSTAGLTLRTFYKISDGTGTSVTATVNTSSTMSILTEEWKGPWDQSPLDKTASNAETTAVTSHDSGTTATQAASDNFATSVHGITLTSGIADTFTNSFVHQDFTQLSASDPQITDGYKFLADTSAASTAVTSDQTSFSVNMIHTWKKDTGLRTAAATVTLSSSVDALGRGGDFGSLRQSGSDGAVSGLSASVTLPALPLSGNLLVVQTVAESVTGEDEVLLDQSGFTETVTQTVGLTWHKVFWKISDGTEQTISFSIASNHDLTLSVTEYEGPFASSPLDKSSSANNSIAQTTLSTGTTAAQSQNGNLAVAVFASFNNAATADSYTNSYVERVEFSITGGHRHAWATKIVSDSSAQETTVTFSESASAAAALLTFKEPATGTVTAAATITLSGDQVGVGKSRAFATSTSSGDLAAIGSIVPLSAAATVTMSGDQAGVGTSRAFATSTMTGDLTSLGTGFVYALATITMTGDVVSNGTTMARATITALGDNGSLATNLGAATIDFIGTLIAGGGTQFASATSTLSGDLVTGGGQHSALATSTASGDLAGTANNLTTATSTASGDLVATAKNLAAATSSLAGDLAAIGTNLSSGVVNAVATVSMAGDLVAAGTSRASATSTLSGDLVATAITRATATSTLAGELAGVGTNMARATITALGDNGSTATLLASGTITLSGDLVAAGTGFVYALATSTLSGTLASAGTLVASATSTVSGALTAGGGTQFASATATLSGTVAAIGTDLTSGQVNALATITASGEVAASGTQRASGTMSAAGDLVATGNNIVLTATATIAIGAPDEKGFIDYIGSGTMYRFGVDGNGGVNLDKPVGYKAGDLLLVTIQGNGAASSHNSNILAGWTNHASSPNGVYVYRRIADLSGDDEFALSSLSLAFAQTAQMHAFDLRDGYYDQVSNGAVGQGLYNSDAYDTEWPAGALNADPLSNPSHYLLVSCSFKYTALLQTVSGVDDTLDDWWISQVGWGNVADATVQDAGNMGAGWFNGDALNPSSNKSSWSVTTYAIIDEHGHPGVPADTDFYLESPDSTGTELVSALSFSTQVTSSQGGFHATWGANDLAAVGTTLASATINLIGDQAGVGIINASATINLIGDQAGLGIVRAFATITLSGDLAAIGSGGATIPVPAAATVSLSGNLQVGGGRFFATSFIPLSGALVAQGQKLVLAAGTISMSGDLLPAVGINFCAVRPTASISMPGTLTAFEDPTDNIVTASTTSTMTGGLSAPPLYHWRIFNTQLEILRYLAHGSIGMGGKLNADVRKVTCITPTATINCAGATLSVGFTDPNKFFKKATITMGGEIGSLALAYSRSATIDLGGDLTVVGRNIDEGSMALSANRFATNIQALSGPATIDGQRKAVLRTAYGSLQIYNNGRGGFYTIGESGALKEAYSTSIFGGSLAAKGQADFIKSRSATISMNATVTADGKTNLPTSVILGTGQLAAKGNHALVTATATLSGALHGVGVQPPLEFTLLDRTVYDIQYGLQQAKSEWYIDNNGFIKTWVNEDSFYVTREQWVDPASAGQSFDDPIYVRATKLSGVTPLGTSLDTWHKLPDGDETWSVRSNFGQGLVVCTLYIELSRDFGTTIDESATIQLKADSRDEALP